LSEKEEINVGTVSRPPPNPLARRGDKLVGLRSLLEIKNVGLIKLWIFLNVNNLLYRHSPLLARGTSGQRS